ncbi:DNA polymerase [Aphelenchoides avenae]|nr:DNA polymerase [Aphelenchus avenae]
MQGTVSQHLRFVEELSHYARYNRKFQLRREVTEVALKNLDQCESPEHVLVGAIAKCIRDAYAKHPNIVKYGVKIESALLDYPIEVPFRSRWQNSPGAILNEFTRVSQSKQSANLYGMPIRISVTGLCPRSGGHRRKSEITHNINEKSLIKVNNPTDGYCMLYALELSRVHCTVNQPGGLTSDQFYRLMKRCTRARGLRGPSANHPSMAGLLEQLFLDCPQLPRGLAAYSVEVHVPLIQAAYDRLYPGKYRIIVFGQYGSYQPCYKGPQRAEHDVCIVHHGDEADGNAHFDGVRCVASLFGKAYYCPDCERAFGNAVDHSAKCVRKCRNCGGFGTEFPCRGGLRIKCSDCQTTFVNRECYDRHFTSMCALFKTCKDCGVKYNLRKIQRLGKDKKHICGQKFCGFCCTYHRTDQSCYIQPLEPKEDEKPCRFVAFDFESTQHNRPDPDKDWFRHEVNFVCALVTCSECIAQDRWKDLARADCKVCGPRKQVTWSVAEGQNALHEFVSWILHGFDKKYITYAWAHYGKQFFKVFSLNLIFLGGRYDIQLVVNEILRMGGLTPEVVRNGHKLYEVRVEKRGIIVPTVFRDSYCLMSQPLSDLVDAYKLDIEGKQFFPHLFNKPANYARHLRHLPKRKYYAPETMKPEKRKAFKDWYRLNRNTPFFLPDKLREYCTNDTQILLHALVAFRSEWMEVCQDDVLRNCMTIASACMRAFKMHHLEEETLVRSPEGGYERHDRQSVIALKYLKWYASTNGVQVRHRDSPGGEYKLEYTDADGARRHFLLDGYVERPGQRPLALEFHGCAYHGCSTCFRDDTLCPNGVTAKINRERTEAREAIIREHMDLHVMWECRLHKMLEDSRKCRCDECDRCHGADVCQCSMKVFFDETHPWGPIDPRDAYFGGRTGPTKLCAKTTPGRKISYFDIQSLYPATNFYTEYCIGKAEVIVKGEAVRWTSPDELMYKGLYKVLVVPPKDLRHPVLPVKFRQHLLFPLCRRCAIDYEKRTTRVLGPLVIGRLQAASGYPEHIRTDAQREHFIRENERVYGIRLDAQNIRKNKAKRQIAKLCLNSLWGRFSMRNNLAKTEIITRPDAFCKIAYDDRLLWTAEMVSEEAVHVSYTHKKDFVEENSSSNIFVSLFTTSAARLQLYKYMRQVADHPRSELLYTHTDSIIFEHPVDESPVQLGEYLGQMSDEYPGDTILRGITLDYRAKRTISFRRFRQQVLRYGHIDPIFVDVSRFVLSKDGTIHTAYGRKVYRAVNQKGIILDSYDVVPFGFCPWLLT